jgi:hypothetical protein
VLREGGRVGRSERRPPPLFAIRRSHEPLQHHVLHASWTAPLHAAQPGESAGQTGRLQPGSIIRTHVEINKRGFEKSKLARERSPSPESRTPGVFDDDMNAVQSAETQQPTRHVRTRQRGVVAARRTASSGACARPRCAGRAHDNTPHKPFSYPPRDLSLDAGVGHVEVLTLQNVDRHADAELLHDES